ncbi:hypothetical protein FSP39_008233 [Pinctada imbricata]|uniref:PIH1 domain-containing protein 2 n=1 Tax=Pinctada imbricata TaxID=66713 RepID=A0AA88YVP6_PINIB|nr:hypothetical protein FSP39_008233 [Pinctada imbricata]
MSQEYDKDSMMKQAQNIWTMLDEMAENNPQAYQKFINEKTKKGMEYMKPPEPHMCVQTIMLRPDQMTYFINFCCWNRVPEPKSSEDAVPVGGTTVFSDTEEDQEKFSYSAVAFNPKILEEYGRKTKYPNDRDTLVMLAIDYIQAQHNVTLSRNYTLLGESIPYKGNLRKMQKAFTGKSDQEMDEQLSELENSFGPLGPGAKDSLLNKLSNMSTGDSNYKVKTNTPGSNVMNELSGIRIPTEVQNDKKKANLIQEISTEVNEKSNNSKSVLACPKYKLSEIHVDDGGQDCLIVNIELPGVLGVRECELDISQDDLELEVPKKFFLHLKLPKEILEDEASAKFLRKSSCLKLTLPLKL